jgi:FkbM family methyltransferase
MAFEILRFELAARMRPLLSRLPRGYGLAYRVLLGPIASTYRGDTLLKQRVKPRIRAFHDRRLDCLVVADVGDAGSRNHFVLGRYYEGFVPLVIRECLSPSDMFVDVGANRGIHTMGAARYLSSGRVIAIEPNPRTFQILQAHVVINNLPNVQLHNLGMSDAEGKLLLNLFADDAPSGCSFIDKGENPLLTAFEVGVQRLDRIVAAADLGQRTLVKIDTEGFEHQVVRGMGALLDHSGMAILTEIVDNWLRKAGSSADALFSDLLARGFKAYVPEIRFEGLRERLHLEPVDRMPVREDQFDLLFTKPGVLNRGP